MSKILLTAIFKDDSEYEEVGTMLASFMPYMQGLAVAITGVSRKNRRLKALIKRYKGYYIETTPQTHPQLYLKDEKGYIFSNFAEARNVVFELASQIQESEKYDWWTWADCDDILLNGKELDKVADHAKELNLDYLFFTYWYGINVRPDGTYSQKDVVIEHMRERLVKPGMFKWISRLHEVTVPIDGNYQPKHSAYEYNPSLDQNVVWVHVTDDKRVMKAMERNTKILELQAKEENHKDPRTLFYLAKTYFDMNKREYYQLAEMLLKEYLEMSGWAEERSHAWEYMGNIYSLRGDHRGAADCYHMGLKEYGNRPMLFLLLAREYSELQDFEQSDFWLDAGTRLDLPHTRTTIGNPLQIKFLAASLKFNQAIRNQNLDESIKWLKIRGELVGEQTDGDKLKVLEEAKQMNEAGKNVFEYAKWLKDTGHKNKIQSLLESLPFDLGREPFASYIANEVSEPKIWGDKTIAYYASFGSEHFEKWSAKSLGIGIGGSETAVIELAKRWVKKGYEVTVYCDPREDEGIYEGVTYKPWYEMNWKDTFNILILWRSPHLLDRDIKAKKLFLDLHDIASNLDYSPERVKKLTKVFFKSEFQRKMLPAVPDSKATVISNGI